MLQALGGTVFAALVPVSALAQAPGVDAVPDAPGAPVLLAAGSLRAPMTEILAAWRAAGGAEFKAEYGPSGKLRQEVEAGRTVDVFASASTDHADALARQGLLAAPQVFAHNDLCVVGTPAVGLRADNLLEVLSRPALRLATSTPVSDPMGDYTWQFFRNADKRQAGLYALFEAKALKLSGATTPVPGATTPYIGAFEQKKADAYVMYCTNAAQTKAALPELNVLRIPDALNVRSAYAIGARKNSAAGAALMRFVLGAQGRTILLHHGFH